MKKKSVKFTSSSSSRNRYTNQDVFVDEEKESENNSEGKTTLKDIVSSKGILKGHNKRNFWLDYPEEPFLESHNPSKLADKSEFVIKFPTHRELFFKENESLIRSALKKAPYHLDFKVDYQNGNLIVFTTPKTFDPFIIMKGKMMMKLLSRGVSVEKAKPILEDNMFCDLISIKILCKNQEIFKKRRKRLFGPSGSTLKALEILTNTHIVIMGGSVSVVGSIEGCKEVRKIVEDCMFNIHPIYRIKELMLINKYKNDENMKGKDWREHLPDLFKKKKKISRRERQKNSKKHQKKDKKKRSRAIPAPQERKEDEMLRNGSYFLQENNEKKKRTGKKRKRSDHNDNNEEPPQKKRKLN